MDIHEYQAKEILSDFGVKVPNGGLAYSPEQAAYRAREMGGDKWIIKAQVHAGGRGKAGGVKLCSTDNLDFRGSNRAFEEHVELEDGDIARYHEAVYGDVLEQEEQTNEKKKRIKKVMCGRAGVKSSALLCCWNLDCSVRVMGRRGR